MDFSDFFGVFGRSKWKMSLSFVVLLSKTVDLACFARRLVSVAPKTPKADFSDFFGVFGG